MAEERTLTPQQKQAVEARGNVLVSAAAGSGKTFVLAERVIDRITGKDPIDADRMLIVTFTKAAAAEMKNRISDRLEKEIVKQNMPVALLRQRTLLERADITTIDSFCASLVREYFESTDLPADFRTADPAVMNSMLQQAIDETFSYYSQTQDAEFNRMVEQITCGGGDRKFGEVLLEMHTYLSALPYPREWMQQVCAQYRQKDAAQTLWFPALLQRGADLVQDALDRLYRGNEILSNEFDEVCEKIFQEPILEDQTFYTHLQTKIKDNDWDACYSLLCDRGDKPCCDRTTTKACDDEEYEVLRAVANAVKTDQKELRSIFCLPLAAAIEEQQRLAPTVEKFMEAVELFRLKLWEKKAEVRQFEFADIELAALQLLTVRQNGVTEPSEIGKQISARYAEVMVDEYQDVNDLQNEIFEILSGKGKNFFTVGDVKQCIYRFRLSDPANFLRRAETLPPYRDGQTDGVVVLSGNFRSGEVICDFINNLFYMLMKKETAGIRYDSDQELDAKNHFYEDDGDVQLHVVQHADEQTDVEAEAEYIAEEIEHLCAHPSVTMNEAEQKHATSLSLLRPARYGEIAILLRFRTHMAEYADALRRRGIPVWTDAAQNLMEVPAVSRVCSLLRVIQNPHDDIALLAVLLSPIFGFSPDELALLRADQRWVGLYDTICRAAAQDNAACQRFLQKLHSLRTLAAGKSLPELLREMLEQTGFEAAVLAGENGADEVAALYDLIRIAEQYAQNGGELSGFLQLLTQHADSFKAPASVGSGEGAVRIMTVHGSKGLEFPICFLADLNHDFTRQGRSSSCLCDLHAGLGLLHYDAARRTKQKTRMYEYINMLAKNEAVAEELRTFYVAATRAKEKLIFVIGEQDFSKKKRHLLANISTYPIVYKDQAIIPDLDILHAHSWSRWLLTDATMHPDASSLRDAEYYDAPYSAYEMLDSSCLSVFVSDSSPLKISLQPQQKIPDPQPDEQLAELLQQNFAWQYPYSALEGIASKMAVTQLTEKHTQRQTECNAQPAFVSRGGLTPAQRGTAMHQFLENADFAAAAVDLQAEIDRLAAGKYLSQKQAECLDVAKLRQFFASDIFRRLSQSKKVLREMRFMSELPATQVQPDLPESCRAETVVIQGIADCVFLEEDGAVILDYKTDRVQDIEILRERYQQQLEVYSQALCGVLGCPIKQKVLYSLWLGQEICV
ncbi:MAG: UvrD-helicase domain-containing protein [Clostridia bacterium]|nr:UvrD-helicase domain-containing protein [Clostridia bacterium]